MNLIADLQERNLIQDIMPGTEDLLNKEMVAGYIGFDPTADSLHVGNLLPITMLMRLQRAGHKPYALLGGATGMIGDPSGKSAERNLLDVATIEHNINCQRKQLEHFLDFSNTSPNGAVLVNNYDWFKDFSFLGFIRDIGKHISVNYMMAKDSVKNRLETGMSFTEFTYQLIQGYDFYHLYNNHKVRLQMGGADQWGNIVTGTELIRRKGGGEAYAFTCKLITKSDGTKFGKSEGGNIWLDRNRTSPYVFYQFWLNLPDADAAKMALVFSFKPVEEIKALIAEHETATHQRKLQKALAEELTILVHSEEDLAFAKQASDILFGQSSIEALRALNEQQLLEVMDGVKQVTGIKNFLSKGIDLVTFLTDVGVFSSKADAKKMVQAGSIYINKEKVTTLDFRLTENHLLYDKYILIQKGKKEYSLAIFKNLNVVFDTNAYRLFCNQYFKNANQEKKHSLLQHLRDCEQKENVTSHLNILVLIELLKHLANRSDPSYYICLQAIQVTFWHTMKNDSVNFIPPPELEVSQEVFGKLPESFSVFLKRMGSLYMDIIQDSSDKNLENLSPAFSELKLWLEEYKLSFIDTYSTYLNSEDPLNSAEWKIHIEDKHTRSKYIAHLRKENRRLELAIGLILFVEKHIDFQHNFTTDDLLKSAERIKEHRKLGFELMLRIVKLFLNDKGYNLSTGNRPNDVIDFLFALSLDNTKARILVSEDKDLHRIAGELNMGNMVMNLEEYLKFINFTPTF